MARALGRACRTLLVAWCCLAACSLTSDLDELQGNPSADASTGDCKSGVDCSGCVGCDAWCACLSSGTIAACVAQCSDGGGATGGVSGSGGSGGTAASGGVPDAGTGGAAGAAGSAGSTGSSGSGGAAGSGGSAGTGGTGFAAGVVHCVTTNDCALGTSRCCLPQFSGSPTCELLSKACSNFGTELLCDGPEDCGGGELCCGDAFIGEIISKSECRSSCASPDIVLCGGTPSVCPNGQSCVPYASNTKYNLCK